MLEGVAYFSVKSIGLSRVNGRKPCTLLAAARHLHREIQAERGAVGRIDAMRTELNTVLDGPRTAAEVQALADTWLGGIGRKKLRRDHCQAIEAVFSLPARCGIEPRPYFERCLEWLRGAFGLPVLFAVIHFDEAAPHAHVLMLPILDGRHVGGAPIDRENLARLRESFFADVAGPAGLKRDTAKVRGPVKQWAIAAVLRQCQVRGIPQANGPLWPVIEAAIERDPTPALLAFEIDPASLRPDAEHMEPESPIKAIGIEPNPIGITETSPEPESLSRVVGFSPDTASKTHRLAIAQAEMRDANERIRVGRVKSAVAAVPQVRTDDGGWTRVRDEYAQDCSAWD